MNKFAGIRSRLSYSIAHAVLVLLSILSASAQTASRINPATQVNWPLVTGTGAPTVACTSNNYGQPYTDSTTGLHYTCSASGWVSGVTTSGAVFTGPISITPLSTAGIVTNTSGGLLGTTITVPVSNGGTGAATAATGLSNLGGLPLSGGTLTGPLTASVNTQINVQAPPYGAKGDCVTDDTAAIQSALTAATNQTVYLPKPSGGCYKVSSPLTLSTAGVSLECAPGSIIRGTTNATIVTLAGAAQMFKSCTVDEANLTSANGVYVNGATSVLLRDVAVLNPKNYSLYVVGSSDVILDHISDLGNVEVLNTNSRISVTSSDLGQLALQTGTSGTIDAVTVVGNHFTVDGATGLVNGGFVAQVNAGGTAVQSFNFSSNTIDVKNTVSTNPVWGISVVSSMATQNCSIANNTINGIGQYFNFPFELGMSGCAVTGNSIYTTDTHSLNYPAMEIYSGHNTFSGNVIEGWGVTSSGMQFYPQGTGDQGPNVVAGNLLENTAATGASVGIALACNTAGAGSLNNQYTGNTIVGPFGTGISVDDLTGPQTCPATASADDNTFVNTITATRVFGTDGRLSVGKNRYYNVTTIIPSVTGGGTLESAVVESPLTLGNVAVSSLALGTDVNGNITAEPTTGTGSTVFGTTPTLTNGYTVTSSGTQAINLNYRPNTVGSPTSSSIFDAYYDYLGVGRWQVGTGSSSGNTYDIIDVQNGNQPRIRVVPGASTNIASDGGYPVTINDNPNGGGTPGTGGQWVYNGGSSPIPTTQTTGTGVDQPSQSAPASVVVQGAPSPSFTLATTTTGGTLAGGVTYYYQVGSCTAAGGKSIPGSEVSIAVPSGTSTNTVTVNINAQIRANAYSIYGRATSGGEQLIAACQTLWQYTDTGTITPSGALPTVDTTNGGVTTPSIQQTAASSTGGTCTMAASTSCTIALGHTYTTPVCIATQQSATLTGGAVGCTVSGATATITAATANSEPWGAWVFGNPN